MTWAQRLKQWVFNIDIEICAACGRKAAAYAITQALRDTLQAQGTRVVSAHSGPIATDIANSAGLGEMAEPAELVPQAIIAAFELGDFHAFPDTMAV